MDRRNVLKAALGASAVTTAAASSLPAPAIAKDRLKWTMVTTWPKNFPGLGTGANMLAELIKKASDGRMEITVYGAGEIVPAFDAIDAVANGTAEMGHGAPYYWKGKVPAAQYIAAMPFGLTAQEQNAWFEFGGGQALADKVYSQMGCKFFPSGNTGVQMGGWYNKEINTIDDFKGLKMRIPGLGGEVVKAAGATVVNRPGGELLTSMQSGDIDAMEWVGPYNDLAFGIHKVAKYYYFPGWHEPATVLDNFINLDAWDKLPPDLKEIVRAANAAMNNYVLSEFTARNHAALETLLNKHKVNLRSFPDALLEQLGGIAGTVLGDLSASDPLSREVVESISKFRKGAMAWTKLSEQAYINARALSYSYID